MSQKNFQLNTVDAAVADCLSGGLSGQPLCVAFSGGIDSTVLLHALCRSDISQLRAVHVDHQLYAESGEWARHCQQFCDRYGVPLTVLKVTVDAATGSGLEAAARAARYGAIAELLQADECLLTAHHRTDQLETYLLQLFRGAGMHGLAAMGSLSAQGALQIARPLLDVPAADVRAYATAQSLNWLEDPSNADIRFDRNYVRHVLVPAVLERWPAADRTVGRAARLSGEALEILEAVAVMDLQGALEGNRLPLSVLRGLSVARQKNLLRTVIRSLDLPIPSEKQLSQALMLMLEARADSHPEVAWPGAKIYRFRDSLWFYPEHLNPSSLPAPVEPYRWDTAKPLDMGPVRGTLRLAESSGGGIAADYLAAELEVSFRKGGERLRPSDKSRTRDLKNLLQESDIPPWMRSHIPLIYSGERLLAVGDLWTNAEFVARPDQAGRGVIWTNHSTIR
jgi:tRNA(Ile)-lysidine synthase